MSWLRGHGGPTAGFPDDLGSVARTRSGWFFPARGAQGVPDDGPDHLAVAADFLEVGGAIVLHLQRPARSPVVTSVRRVRAARLGAAADGTPLLAGVWPSGTGETQGTWKCLRTWKERESASRSG
jgi:hypothetical protein